MKTQKKFIAALLTTAMTATVIHPANAEDDVNNNEVTLVQFNEDGTVEDSIADDEVDFKQATPLAGEEEKEEGYKAEGENPEGYSANAEELPVSAREAESTSGAMVSEIPTVTSVVTPTDSPVRVMGTKDWDKDLVLTPVDGDINVNLNLSGTVPTGTKVELKDGGTTLATTTVDSAGTVALKASNMPKDVKNLSIVASGDGVMGLSDAKCTANNGIDIPSSKDATLKALTDFEGEYEKAFADYQKKAEEAKNNSTEETTVVEDGPGETKTETTTSQTVKPGEDKGGQSGSSDTWKFEPSEWLKGIGIAGGLGLGGGLLGLLAGPISKIFGDKVPNLDKLLSGNQKQMAEFFGQFNLGGLGEIGKQIQATIERVMRDINDPSKFGLGNLGGLDKEIKKWTGIDINDILKQLRQVESDIKAQIQGILSSFEKDPNPLFRQAANWFKGIIANFRIEQLLPLLIIPLIGLLIWAISDSFEKEPGKPNDDSSSPDKTSDVVGTKTTVVPGPKVTKTIPGKKVDMPNLELPTPPAFIENTLPNRDLPTNDVDGGFGFKVEVGSTVDCAATLNADTPKDDTTKKDNKTTNSTTKEKNVSKSTTRDNVSRDDSPRRRDDYRRPYSPAPAPRVNQAPMQVAPLPVQPMAAPKYGPKVDTGGAVEVGLLQKIANILS